jgi:hypothetical protein
MSRKQGPRSAGMRPAAIAACHRQEIVCSTRIEKEVAA